MIFLEFVIFEVNKIYIFVMILGCGCWGVMIVGFLEIVI